MERDYGPAVEVLEGILHALYAIRDELRRDREEWAAALEARATAAELRARKPSDPELF